jgi:hypothetical protein
LPGAIIGQCICPQGTTLVNGTCVPTSPPPPTCDPPLVMIPGVGCRCPGNEVLRRGKCGEPEKPKRKIKCPRGTDLRDGECVKHKREPHIEPGDVIRALPGFTPRGGGGGGATPGRK